MKKIIKFIKSNILGFLVGISLCLNGVIIAENMLSSEQVSYSGTKTEQTTVKGTLDQLFDAVDINERLGSTDISSIGNGTVTGAVSTLNTNVKSINNSISELNSDLNSYIIERQVSSESIVIVGNTAGSFTFNIEQIEGYEPFVGIYSVNGGGGSLLVATNTSQLLSSSATSFSLNVRNISTNSVTAFGYAIVFYKKIVQ